MEKFSQPADENGHVLLPVKERGEKPNNKQIVKKIVEKI